MSGAWPIVYIICYSQSERNKKVLLSFLLNTIYLSKFALIISFVFAFRVSAYDKTDLKKAKATRGCSDCDLTSAFLSRADLSGANLSRADLSEVPDLNIEHLSEVATLYEAKIDPELKKQVKDEYPHLLKKP